MSKNTSLESTSSHVRYMDFIAPKKRPTSVPAGRPVKEVAKKSAPSPAKAPVKPTPVKSAAKSPAKSALAKPAPAAKSSAKAPAQPEAPDAASYTLGGKSPFLASVNVEKRPLSGAITSSDKPRKNTYLAKQSIVSEPKKSPTKIIQPKQKKSGGLGIFFIIILTMILGALVGAAAYFILPK